MRANSDELDKIRRWVSLQLKLANESSIAARTDTPFSRGFREALIRVLRKIDGKEDNTDG